MINSIDAVLDEQEEQWEEGKEEPELIAEIYAEYAKPLAREAHLIGLRDAEEGYKSFDLDLIQTLCVESEISKKKSAKLQSRRQKGVKLSEPSTSTCMDGSSSLSVLSSLSSSPSLRGGGSIASLSLNDPSVHSINEEGDSIAENNEKGNKTKRLVTKNNSGPELKHAARKDENKKPTHQKKSQPRRSLLDRKHGTELSPFVFRRDGTIMFRKPDVEKLKREQSEKRRNCIKGSLTKFLDDNDDEEEDYLAGLLSAKSKKRSVSSGSRI